MKSNMIKVMAMRAKNRMINKGVNDSYYDSRIRIINNDDTEFVDKVRKILQDEQCNQNPLKILMDDKRVTKLDEQGKERYLLETVEKYLKAKAQIESEQAIS